MLLSQAPTLSVLGDERAQHLHGGVEFVDASRFFGDLSDDGAVHHDVVAFSHADVAFLRRCINFVTWRQMHT